MLQTGMKCGRSLLSMPGTTTGVPLAETADRRADDEVASPRHVRAVKRAIELLLCFSDPRRVYSLPELTQRVGYSKSTVFRLLATLETLDIVEREAQGRGYRLGPRLQQFGREAWAGDADPRQVAGPLMLALRDECGETVTLHLVNGLAHVVVEQCESPHEVRRIMPIGRPIPLIVGATAKVILAFLPPEEAARMVAAHSTPELKGPSTEELSDIRSLGYTLSISERVPDACAISAPILQRPGSVWGALSVSGPSSRFTVARATRTAQLLTRAAGRISLALGYDSGAHAIVVQ
jgi:DNA-binding IclR family transcriptional regulator